MEILKSILICTAVILVGARASHLETLPSELHLKIIAQADSVDAARELLVKLDATNKQFHALVRDGTTIGVVIRALAAKLAQPIPFVASMLHTTSPQWLKQVIMRWFSRYATETPKDARLQTVASLNQFYALDPEVKNKAVLQRIQDCIEMLIASGITIKDTNQESLTDGMGIQLLIHLFVSGRDHIELAMALLNLGVKIDFSFELEQGVTWYDKRANVEQRRRVKPFLQLLARLGGCLKSPQAITINEMNQLGLPICPD